MTTRKAPKAARVKDPVRRAFDAAGVSHVYLLRVGEWFLAWRDDEPVAWGMRRGDLLAWQRDLRNRHDLYPGGCLQMMADLDTHGTTRRDLPGLEENRCGVGGTRITEAEIVTYFCERVGVKARGVEVPARKKP